MADTLADSIDEVTPRGNGRGSVTLSAWAWAAHRYTMAALLLVMAAMSGVLVHDYLNTRSEVQELKADRRDAVDDHENRLALLEGKQNDIVSMVLTVGKDVREVNSSVNTLMREVEVIKSRLPAR